MDIGVYWSGAVLEHKLDRAENSGPVEEVWNCRRLPQGLGQDPEGDRLYVACGGRWLGYFKLVPEVLFNPDDENVPYTLIFDAKSWTSLASSIPCRRFRGWTYQVPDEVRREPSGR